MNLQLLEQITSNGLFSTLDDEPYFSRQGCAYCYARTGKHLGNDVYDCQGYKSLQDAIEGTDNLYDFRLCAGCLCAIHNSDPWPEEE